MKKQYAGAMWNKLSVAFLITLGFMLVGINKSYAQPGHVVISQVYGAGGNSGATYTNDFIELFNPTASSVSLAGWSVQYASTTGSSWNVTALSGSIAAGGYFLIQEAAGAGNPGALPTPNVTGTIAMAASAGKVALLNVATSITGGTSCPSGATVVDFVGYGTGTNCFEGAGPTGTIAATTSAIRASGGCQDNDNNAADFSVAAVSPRNSSSAANFCTPATQATTVTFTGVQSSQFDFNFTNGNGSARAAFILIGNTGNASPVNGNTYTASTIYGAGTQIGASGWYCIYNSGGAHASPITITGLAASTTYRIMVCEYNGSGSTAVFNANPATGNPANQLTNSAASPSLIAGAVSASFGNVCINTTAGPQNFSLSGTNLDGSPVNLGALAGFSYCLTSGGTYTSTLPVPYTAPTLGATTIFVKFTPTLVQSYNNNISVTGGGSAGTTTAVAGSGINTLPTTASGAASSITAFAATVAGTITDVGCGTLSTYGIEYSTSNGFSNGSGTPVSSGNLSGINFTSALSGLSPNTVYYYHSYATNSSAGTAYGSQGTFTTLNIDAPVATAATSIANHSFDANWNTVTGATNYRLDVSTNSNFYVASTTPVVQWNFPGNPDDNIADGGIPLNASKTLDLFGCLAAVSYAPASGSTTSAATTASASGGWASGSGNDYWEISMVTAGYYNLKVSSAQRSSATGPRDFKLQYKIGAGGTYTDVPGGTITVGSDWTTGVMTTVSLPAICENRISVFLRWIMNSNFGVNGSAAGTGGTSAIDNIEVIGNAGSFVAGYNNLTVAGLTQTVSGLNANSTYYYRVRATAGSSTSDNSNVISVTTTCTPPAIGACPSNIVQCDNNVVTWTDPTATGDPAATVVCSPLSGSTFSPGTTSVTCTATNGCGSPSSCSFNVTINTTPVIGACPGDITQCNDAGICDAIVNFSTPSATGLPVPTVVCVPPSGSTFLGGNSGNTTVVTCTATNTCGSSACSFNVTVHDCEAPVITVPASDKTVECDGSGNTADFNDWLITNWADADATDNCNDAALLDTYWTNDFTTFNYTCGGNVGNSGPVIFHVHDRAGNNSLPTNAATFTIVDTQAPVIGACPGNITQCNNHVATWTDPSVTDVCGATVVCSPASGSSFATGATTVTCTATDCGGNTDACSFTVTINETPVIGLCPSDITTCNPVVTFATPSASGTPAPTVTCTPSSGSTFPVGTTSVTCTATNSCGSSSCSFNVTINASSTDPTSASSNAPYGQVCLGGSVGITVSGGTFGLAAGYVWYEGGCGTGGSIGTGASINVTPLTNGTHTYYARIEGTCNNTNCVSVSVNVISAPPSGTVHYTAALTDGCVGAPASAFSVNAVPGTSFYRWTSGQAGVRFNGNPSPFETTTPTVNVTFVSLPAAGSSGWSICVFGGNACGNTNTICAWVRATVSAPSSIVGSVIGCPGSIANPYSSSNVAGAASYQWSSTGGIIVNGNGAQSVSVDFPSGFVSGTLSVHGQTACGYNGPNRTITITANPVIPGIITGSSYPCPNASSSYSIAAVPGAANYTWTTSVPGAVVAGTTTTCSITFPTIIPGGSTVSVVANSSCPTSSPVRSKGIANGLPGTPLVINGPAAGQCGQTGVSYSVSPVAGATAYNWTSSCGTIQGPNNLSGITMDWPGNMTGCTISVNSLNACGSSAVRTLTVTGAPNTPTSISGNTTVCPGGVETYCAIGSTGATSFIWTIPAGAVILGPSNGSCILVLLGATGGNVTAKAINDCGNSGIRTLALTMIVCRQSQVSGTVSALNAEVYPNPATEKATLKFNAAAAGHYHLNMTDVLGQHVLSTDGTSTEGLNTIELDLSTFAKGIYTLSVMINGSAEQIRLIVE